MKKRKIPRSKVASIFTSLTFILTCWISSNAYANLMNTDFSAGFEHWQGEVLIFDGVSDDTASGVGIPDIFTDNFQLSGNEVTLQTSFDDPFEHWSVVLFQDVVFDPVAAGSSLMISLDTLLGVTDNGPFGDLGFVQLRDLSTNDTLDLTAGGLFDISTWIGVDATFEIGVQDGDFNLADLIQVSNLTVFEQTAQVPTPTTLALFFLAIVGISAGRRN